MTCAPRRCLAPLCAGEQSPQLAHTDRHEALARGNPGGFRVPPPLGHVQTASCRTPTPCCGPLRQAAAGRWGRGRRRGRGGAAGGGVRPGRWGKSGFELPIRGVRVLKECCKDLNRKETFVEVRATVAD